MLALHTHAAKNPPANNTNSTETLCMCEMSLPLWLSPPPHPCPATPGPDLCAPPWLPGATH